MKKDPKLFIQRKYSFKRKMVVRPGLPTTIVQKQHFSPKNTAFGLIFSRFIHFSYEYRTFVFIQ